MAQIGPATASVRAHTHTHSLRLSECSGIKRVMCLCVSSAKPVLPCLPNPPIALFGAAMQPVWAVFVAIAIASDIAAVAVVADADVASPQAP